MDHHNSGSAEGKLIPSPVEKSVSMPIGVIVERRDSQHAWADHSWRPVAVVVGGAPVEPWTVLRSGDGWEQYHVATLPLELHRKETEAYKVALTNEPPHVFVVLRSDETSSEREVYAHLVTASAFEAQDYLDSGEEIVEGVPMPDGLIAWVRAFVERHHVEEKFKKRKRRQYDAGEEAFGRRPLVGPNAVPDRRNQGGEDV